MVGIVSSLSSETRAQTLASLLEQTEVLRQQNAALGLWGKIRLELNRHRSFPDAEWAMAPEEVALLADTYARLTPSDVVVAHAWLFDNRIRLPNPLPALSNSLEDRDNQIYEAQENAIRAVYAPGRRSLGSVSGERSRSCPERQAMLSPGLWTRT